MDSFNKTGKVRTSKSRNCPIEKVSKLIKHFRWDKNLIWKIFRKEDAENILKIPISLEDSEDFANWNHTTNGV